MTHNEYKIKFLRKNRFILKTNLNISQNKLFF